MIIFIIHQLCGVYHIQTRDLAQRRLPRTLTLLVALCLRRQASGAFVVTPVVLVPPELVPLGLRYRPLREHSRMCKLYLAELKVEV